MALTDSLESPGLADIIANKPTKKNLDKTLVCILRESRTYYKMILVFCTNA